MKNSIICRLCTPALHYKTIWSLWKHFKKKTNYNFYNYESDFQILSSKTKHVPYSAATTTQK